MDLGKGLGSYTFEENTNKRFKNKSRLAGIFLNLVSIPAILYSMFSYYQSMPKELEEILRLKEKVGFVANEKSLESIQVLKEISSEYVELTNKTGLSSLIEEYEESKKSKDYLLIGGISGSLAGFSLIYLSKRRKKK